MVKSLEPLLPQAANILDLGGGDGRLAIALAARGHHSTIVDSDADMLASATSRIAAAGYEAQIELVLADAQSYAEGGFDLVCCHSVLMYLRDPALLLQACSANCRTGGAISVISLNPAASAMRAGLQQRWKPALAVLAGHPSPDEAASFDHDLQSCAAMLADLDCQMIGWYGVGVFTDHLHQSLALAPDAFDTVVDVETLAGATDPYRQVARCWHLIARKIKDDPAP